ncbi:MAG: DUF1292 domain-containing protein [Negativicutes bacterium]|nr:DUF1292 domain-containing protein [Negativicutes bacterium]
MDDKELEMMEDEEQIIVMSDDEGNEFYYREEMVIPLGDKNFALLIPIDECECDDEECVCREEENEEPDVYIARIDFDEDGEAVYLDPTEEEFEAVKTAYEEMMNSSEE